MFTFLSPRQPRRADYLVGTLWFSKNFEWGNFMAVGEVSFIFYLVFAGFGLRSLRNFL